LFSFHCTRRWGWFLTFSCEGREIQDREEARKRVAVKELSKIRKIKERSQKRQKGRGEERRNYFFFFIISLQYKTCLNRFRLNLMETPIY
jgi:hypothetical protein